MTSVGLSFYEIAKLFYNRFFSNSCETNQKMVISLSSKCSRLTYLCCDLYISMFNRYTKICG